MGRHTKRKISSNLQKRTSLGRFTSGTRLPDVSSTSSEDKESISEDEWLDHFNEEDVEILFVNAVQMAENENSVKLTPWTTGCDPHN
jgi:hypothetical protein